MKSRKTAVDYKKDYKNATDKVSKLENEINERLFFLATNHPDVPIVYLIQNTDKSYKAKCLADKFYISTMHINTRIEYIKIIETYLSELVGKQIEINFNEKA